jgi:hemolysin D
MRMRPSAWIGRGRHRPVKMVNLSPGMTVAVEIKSGSRRLIEYILSPLLRYKQETLRER